MKPLSDRVQKVAPSGIRKYFDLASMSQNIISLGVGEPDFDTPEKIKEAGKQAIEFNKTHYTANSGLIELREKISDKLKRENRIDVSPENVLITAGSSEGLDLAVRSFVNPRENILIPEPCYVAYGPLLTLADAEPKYVKCREENDFRVLTDDLKKDVDEKTKALLICSPNNPTGAVLRKKDLEEIADFVIEKDLFVISDEIYEKLIYSEEHISIASLNGMAERTVTLNGFSKAFACTGWRVGYMAGSETLMSQIKKIHQYNILCAPSISQYAMLPAFEENASVRNMVKIYDRRRRLLVKGLNELPGVSCHMPGGAFYTFPNISGTGMKSGEFAELMIKDAEVALVPGNVFGPSGEGFVRCSYSTSTEAISEAIERMKGVL
jgi:aminotransferase